LLGVILSWNLALAFEPVQVFVAKADSIAGTHGDEALANYIAENTVLVGNAVGMLLDDAINDGDTGNKDGERERMGLAERISRHYYEQSGSSVLLDLVTTYKSWTPDQRTRRSEAKAFDAQATTIRNQGIQTGEAAKFSEAAGLFNQARSIYEDIGDARSVAVSWGSLGVVHYYARDFVAAETDYQHALEARRGIEDRLLEGNTLNALGTTNFQLERYGIAADYFRQAVDLRTETGDLRGLGSSLTYLGNTYLRLGRQVDARDAYEKGLDILEAVGNANQLYENLNSIAGLYFDMGRLEASNEAYERALDLAVTTGNTLGQIKCRNNLALNFRAQYRYTEAISHLDEVGKLLEHYTDPAEAIVYHRNRGLTYMDVGELDEAQESLVAFLKEAQNQQSVRMQIEAQLDIGYLYRDRHYYDHALKAAEKVKTMAEASGNNRMIRASEMLAAEVERTRGNYDAALEHWYAALENDRALGLEIAVLEDQVGIAGNLALAGREEEARELCHSVRAAVERSQQPNLIQNLYFVIAHSYEKTDPDSSRYYNERVLTLLEETRASLKGDQLRSGFLGGIRRYYYEEIARYYASVAMKDPESEWSSRAFETIERAKGRGLLDLLETSVLSKETQEEAELLDAVHRLDKSAPDYASEHAKLTQQYETLRDERLKTSLESLASADVTGIKQVQEALPKKAVILAYALGDSVSLLWAIDQKGHELYELPSRGELELDVQRLRDALANPGAGDAALRLSSRRLYEALVAPAESRLNKSKKLIIVPDGVLFSIPFEVLLTEDIEDTDEWGTLPFFARKHSPVYAPSVSIYLNLEKNKKKRDHDLDLLAVGDPDFTTLAQSGAGSRGTPLEPLPYTRAEVLSISAHVDEGQKGVLLGEDANEARFKQELRNSSPRLLHLATHGLIDPNEPAASSIALGADAASGEDGYLYTMEILALPLDVDLVVLSACESGTGKLNRSEGVVGLSRAFIASGANGIVASLWAVSDQSTSVLMEEFYNKMLGKKRPAGEALNEARFALIDNPEYAHPFYWSPFIVIGSERSPW